MRSMVLAACLIASSPATAMTATELMPACELVPDVPVGRQMSLPAEAAPCWWYLGAMHDAMGVDDVPHASVIGTCGDRDASFTDVARLFVAYVRTHPRVAGERAALGAILALREAYPCR